MARRKQSWRSGDVFVLKGADGRFSVGQVLGHEAEVLNSASIVLFRQRFSDLEEVRIARISEEDAISVVFTTRDLLDCGQWKVIENRPICMPREHFPYESLRASGFVGAKVYGSGIVATFMDAFFGLAAWDGFKDPNYLDRLLLSPKLKPQTLLLKHES